MSDQLVSVDEFLASRKHFVKSGDVLMKAARQGPSTWDPKTRSVRFVMSAEVEDRDRDIVIQAGLDIEEFLANPVAPLQHRSGGFPVGSWRDVAKNLTGRPKRTEGTLQLVEEGVDQDADRLARHIAAGTIRACSIGFIPKAVVKRSPPDNRKSDPSYWPGYSIEEASLIECSPVTIPSCPASLAKMAAHGDVIAREILEDVLDNWAKHPETGLIIPRSEFEASHKEATGGRTTVVLPPPQETAVEGEGTPSPDPEAAPIGPRERSLVRRALDLMFPENEAKLTAAIKAAEAEEAAAEQEALARKTALDERRRQATEKSAALEERLRSKGLLTESA